MHKENPLKEIPDYFRSIEIRGFEDVFLPNTNFNLLILKLTKIMNIPNSFDGNYPNLYFLELNECNLNSYFPLLNNDLKLLHTLKIIKIPLENLSFLAKMSCRSLQFLIISWSKLRYIKNQDFKKCLKMKHFEISNSFIAKIDGNFLKYLNLLTELNFKNTIYPYLDNLFQIPSKKITTFHGNSFPICCFLWKTYGHQIKCTPKEKNFLTCSKLISFENIAIFCWFYSIFGIILNFISLMFLLVKTIKSKHYLVLLTLADLQVSLYFLVLVIADTFYGDDYLKFNKIWKESVFCQILGIFISNAVQLSIFNSFLIIIEKYYVIVHSMRGKSLFFEKNAKFLCSFICCLSIVLSILPLFAKKVIFKNSITNSVFNLFLPLINLTNYDFFNRIITEKLHFALMFHLE